MSEPDYIIVGAGSAGCVLADRLSAGGASVLVLEAGGPDRDPLIHIPIGLGRMHDKRSHDWGYDSEPEPQLDGREIEAMRGKVLGGSSSINFMGYVRGNRGDYDRWAARGLAGWSYADVLPYFRRSESWELGADAYRGGDGPLHVAYSRDDDPIFDAFRIAAEDAGYPHLADYNGARQEGTGRAQNTIHRGRRQSGAVAYLRPALGRANLTVETGAHATSILMSGTSAIGIEYVRGGARHQAHAAREVILAAGVFNSPQLLMLSGIGPADHLKAQGIAPVIDSTGVGANLQDHLGISAMATRSSPGPFWHQLRFDRLTVNMARAYLFGAGPATVLPSLMHGFIKTEPGLDVPDIQLIFRGVSPVAHPWFPGIRKAYRDACTVRAILLHPSSRGRVELRSANPFDRVRIFQNFLAEASDIRTLGSGLRIARALVAHKALDGIRAPGLAPGFGRDGDGGIDGLIRASSLTAHHPMGTCAMGADTDADAVLDGELRVRGAENLRVVDASAMPDLVSGNINACVVMIAEKASDHILGRTPLAATPV